MAKDGFEGEAITAAASSYLVIREEISGLIATLAGKAGIALDDLVQTQKGEEEATTAAQL